MSVSSDNANDVHHPLIHIPRHWLERAHCPICNNSSLRILSLDDGSEQFQCGACTAAFEISHRDPSYIRLTRIPVELEIFRDKLLDNWHRFSQVRKLIATGVSTQPPVPAPDIHQVEEEAPVRPAPEAAGDSMLPLSSYGEDTEEWDIETQAEEAEEAAEEEETHPEPLPISEETDHTTYRDEILDDTLADFSEPKHPSFEDTYDAFEAEPSPVILTNKEVLQRVRELRDLYMSNETILQAVQKAGGTSEQIENALTYLDQLQRAQKAQSSTTLWIVLGIMAIIIIILILILAFYL